jgi:hypothetical protein
MLAILINGCFGWCGKPISTLSQHNAIVFRSNQYVHTDGNISTNAQRSSWNVHLSPIRVSTVNIRSIDMLSMRRVSVTNEYAEATFYGIRDEAAKWHKCVKNDSKVCRLLERYGDISFHKFAIRNRISHSSNQASRIVKNETNITQHG